jgi:subtilase family serine protease
MGVTLTNTIAPGTYFIGTIADQWNSVKESDESNNALAGSQITVIGPDLTVTALSGPASTPTGNTITVTNTVTAAASAGSVKSGFYVYFYLSRDSVITASDTNLGSRHVPSLAAGASSTESTLLRIPDGYDSGSFSIVAVVDYYDDVKESDETNNTASITITVIGPDLTITQVSGPANATFGQYITVNNTVTTAADGGKPGTVDVHLFLSTDNVITSDDIYLGGRHVYDLAPGASSSDATTVLIPYDLKRGTYYIGAIADYQDYVNESNEANNALAGNTIFIKR